MGESIIFLKKEEDNKLGDGLASSLQYLDMQEVAFNVGNSNNSYFRYSYSKAHTHLGMGGDYWYCYIYQADYAIWEELKK